MEKKAVNGEQNVALRELNRLGVTTVRRQAFLRPWIECIWSVKSVSDQPKVERLYPDGGSSLVFDFSRDNSSGVGFNTQHQAIDYCFRDAVDLIGVRFRPGGAHAVLGLQAGDLLACDELPQLKTAINLYERMGSCENTAAAGRSRRLYLLQQWLTASAVRHEAAVGPLQGLVSMLESSHDSIDKISRDTGCGRRRMERLFQQQIGLAPNQVKRLLRVRAARYRIKQSPRQNLAAIAQDCGYYDQAHFIRHFKQVTGYLPGAYQRKQQLKQNRE